MKTRTLTLAVTSALLGMTAQVQAAGFQLAETSATGLGRAFAGEAAMADNASAQARNPAMLSYLKGTQVSGGVIYVRPDIDIPGSIQLESTKIAGTKIERRIPGDAYDVAGSAYIPNFYISHQLNDQFTLGLAVNSNYGLSTGIDADHNAAVFGNKTSVKTVEFNPNIGYRVNEAFTLGAGLRVVHGEGEIGGSTPKWADDFRPVIPELPPVGAPLKEMKGDDYGYGWQAGASWQINQANRIGLSYHSKIDFNLDGHASGATYFTLDSAGKPVHKIFNGYIPLELPAFAELASYHQITDNWAMHASINWTDWSSFKELTAHFPDESKPVSPITGKPMDSDLIKQENFKDNWRFALGSTYQVTQDIQLRGGVAYDRSAVSNEHRTTTIPDSDRLWLSLGMGYQATKMLDFDLGVTYIRSVGDSAINETIHLTPETQVTFNGETSGNVVLAGIQMNYKF